MTIRCLLRTAWATSRSQSTSHRTRPPHPPQARRPQDQLQQPRQQRRPRRRQQPQHQQQDLQQIPTSLTTTQEMSTQPSCRYVGNSPLTSSTLFLLYDLSHLQLLSVANDYCTPQAERRFEERHRAKVSKVRTEVSL